MEAPSQKFQKIEAAIAAQEALRGMVPDAQIETTLAALRAQLLLARAESGSAVAQGTGNTALAAGATQVQTGGGDVALGDKNTAETIVIVQGGTVVLHGEQPVKVTTFGDETPHRRYLTHLIENNRYLTNQLIVTGSKVVNIELEEVYVTLHTEQARTAGDETWLAAAGEPPPGERENILRERAPSSETVRVTVNQALASHRLLVVLGDPGSGKTTLLRYLALHYARDLAQGTAGVRANLGLEEGGCLPIFLALRGLGAYLREHFPADDGTDGHAILLQFIREAYRKERILLPDDFFDPYLASGRAAILLDGLDEVADPELRRRVARLVEQFTQAYAACRFVVTSRVVGYTGSARLGGDYRAATVRDFTLAEVETFLTHWHRLVTVGLRGPGEAADHFAASQTAQLMAAIRGNPRIRELAINPLLLTVIALVHRDRAKLPDRRAELYGEAVEMLLGKWDEAKGLGDAAVLEGAAFDTGDKRLMLQSLALHMHAQEQKEIPAEDLRNFLSHRFAEILPDERAGRRAVERFQRVIEERTGLLVARGEGVYAFSHLTFQEYLAAVEIAAGDDYVPYMLARSGSAWWREVILLEAGYLSGLKKERAAKLIRAIADSKNEPAPYHNLVLAAECLRDVGENRIPGNLEAQIRVKLRRELGKPVRQGWVGALQSILTRGMSLETLTNRRIAAANALGTLGGSQYWSLPHGEPEWVNIPAGEFWMGEGQEVHILRLDVFSISRIPITNAQYALFIAATGHEPPAHWEEGRIPKGRESHPVVHVMWHDALAYCRWLGSVTGKAITLPSEAEWEKAARGDKDQRAYPWGDTFDAARCNTRELGLGSTTPAGIFLEGASPYGVLDLSGNVWEWTRSRYEEYPYQPNDGRENLEAGDNDHRVLRGGSFLFYELSARCAARYRNYPFNRLNFIGFRVVVSPSS